MALIPEMSTLFLLQTLKSMISFTSKKANNFPFVETLLKRPFMPMAKKQICHRFFNKTFIAKY